MARPTKLTPEVLQKLCELLRAGNSRRAACQVAGVSEDSLARWMKRSPEGFAGFADTIVRAEAEFQASAVTHIRKAGAEHDVTVVKTSTRHLLVPHEETRPDGTVIKTKRAIEVTDTETTAKREYDWQADAWLLERRNPEDWKPRSAVEHVGKNDGAIEVKHDFNILRALPPDELLRLHRESLGASGEDRKR